jgi:hypothetical protein
MPTEVRIGQKWAMWVSSRHQWLLATVTVQEGGQATLKFDARYGMDRGYDENKVDEATMLTHSNLFRFIESES